MVCSANVAFCRFLALFGRPPSPILKAANELGRGPMITCDTGIPAVLWGVKFTRFVTESPQQGPGGPWARKHLLRAAHCECRRGARRSNLFPVAKGTDRYAMARFHRASVCPAHGSQPGAQAGRHALEGLVNVGDSLLARSLTADNRRFHGGSPAVGEKKLSAQSTHVIQYTRLYRPVKSTIATFSRHSAITFFRSLT
jgi:hypothetical protein